MAFTVKSDHIIMDQLGVTELRHLIAETNKGSLTLMLRKGETSYRLVLDAVPLEEPTNKELIAMIFPVKQMEVPQVKKDFFSGIDSLTTNKIPPTILNVSGGKVVTTKILTGTGNKEGMVNQKGELVSYDKMLVKKKPGRPRKENGKPL